MRGRWRRLLNLIDHLPRNSYYVEAMSDDEELAEALLSQPRREDIPSGPRMSQWSPEAEALAALADQIAVLWRDIVAMKSGKPPRIKPAPRPATAADRVRSKQRIERHASLVERVLRR